MFLFQLLNSDRLCDWEVAHWAEHTELKQTLFTGQHLANEM